MPHSCGNVGTRRPPGWENRRYQDPSPRSRQAWGCEAPRPWEHFRHQCGSSFMNSRNFQLELCSGMSFWACQNEGWQRRQGLQRGQKRWPPGSIRMKGGSSVSVSGPLRAGLSLEQLESYMGSKRCQSWGPEGESCSMHRWRCAETQRKFLPVHGASRPAPATVHLPCTQCLIEPRGGRHWASSFTNKETEAQRS